DWSSDVCSSDLRGAHQLAAILLELALQPLEQGEGIGRRPGEPGDDLSALADAPHLAGIGLHHRIAHGNLAIAGNHRAAVLLHPDDGGAVPLDEAVAAPVVVHAPAYGEPRRRIKKV